MPVDAVACGSRRQVCSWRLTYASRTALAITLSCALSLLGACAGTQPKPESARSEHPGDADAPPALDVLPEPLPVESDRVHRALTQASEVLSARFPAIPSDRSHASLSAWVESDVAHWIERRREGVEDTRYLFGLSASNKNTADKAASDQPAGEAAAAAPVDIAAGQVVVAHAVLGLLHEDTALQLEQIPAPSELDQEPEIAEMFREIIRAQMAPFISAALREYGECANTAYAGDEELEAFGQLCHARHDRLKAERATRN